MDCIISTIVTPVIDAIHNTLFQEIGYVCSSGSNVRNLKRISSRLSQIEDEVQGTIATAMAASDEMTPTKQVKEWMKEVQTMVDVMVKIDEEYNSHKACQMINYWLRYKIGKRAAEAIEEAEELVTKWQQFKDVIVRSAPAIRRMLTLPNATLSSTEMYLRNAIDNIRDVKVRMVGIWGMGGVGKTTLLQMINNHPSIKGIGYDFVIWLVASQELDFLRLQIDVAKRVGLELEDTWSLEDRARVLHRYLKEKTFLLLLDDVWKPFDLAKEVGIPYPSASNDGMPKHKVVVTTRFETVCDQMIAFSQLVQARSCKIRIECLPLDEAWELFLHSVGEGMRSIISTDQRVGRRARKVANKCGGLPLALVVIARTMAANRTWQEWEDAINLINTSRIQEMWIEGSDPFPLLKVSYDRLPDDRTKKCFLSCAFWSEDSEIGVGELIECWLGMNLIENGGNIIVNHRKGYTMVECLKRACMLDHVDDFDEDKVKMHDIIREMALWIISSDQRKWMSKSRYDLKDESADALQWKEAEIISLSQNYTSVSQIFESAHVWVLPRRPDCPKLSSLMLRSNYMSAIPEGFFQNMPTLTFLDLSQNNIVELPPAFYRLLQLRHLNLSQNRLDFLPAEFGNLVELRVLLLNDMRDLFIPRGLISKLQKLEHLSLINASAEWDKEAQACIIEELARSSITSLELAFTSLENAEQLANNRSISLWFLVLRFFTEITTLLLPSTLLQIGNTSSILSKLHIVDCHNLVNISISSRPDEEFESLESFKLSRLDSLKKITFLGPVHGSPLQNVRFLTISYCGSLRSAIWILQLPYIESLQIWHCFKIEYVIGEEEAEDSDEIESVIGNEEADQGGSYAEADLAQQTRRDEENSEIFPHLKSLILCNLPELRRFSTHASFTFPSLKNLEIRDCPLLHEGPFHNMINPTTVF